MTETNRKLSRLLAEAVEGLDPADRAERIAWCQETGQHGVSGVREGESIVFMWGGRTLAVVEGALLADDELELPPGQRIAGVPDTVPDDWQG
ncbi:hypothetical protein [Nocardioides sp. HB32]